MGEDHEIPGNAPKAPSCGGDPWLQKTRTRQTKSGCLAVVDEEVSGSIFFPGCLSFCFVFFFWVAIFYSGKLQN